MDTKKELRPDEMERAAGGRHMPQKLSDKELWEQLKDHRIQLNLENATRLAEGLPLLTQEYIDSLG